MKKFLLFVLFVAIAGGIIFFVVKTNNQNDESVVYEDVEIEKVSDSDVAGIWNAISSEISNGIEAVGNGIKSGIDKLKGDSSNKKSSDEKNLLEKIGDKLKEGKDEVEKNIDTYETTTVTGKLVVRGNGSETKCYVKTGFFRKVCVKTISGSENSYSKLAKYKGKKIKVTGILNKESKEIVALTYKVATEN